ncbi:MAG: class I tRNA ligase family protein, partial [Syntrophobacterales bacterium]|nr:class I tRNA ligase family protein [Syntrophobacterales bacterium]
RHPLTDKESLLILAPFVTLDAGTGCVHIAPGHGQEDYDIGMKYGLENYAPVDVDGNFTDDVEFFAGQFVFDANDGVIAKLQERNALMGSVMLEHSYPHCWRCKQPIIFRSTEQWFISMDKTGLREKALDAVKEVRWIPSWGRDRMFGMIENRPDWCISRQRLWGVPITIFYCERCDQELLTRELLDNVVSLVRQHGADVWFEREAADLVLPGTACPACGHDRFRKDSNILDVWFDSGVSHAAVLEKRPELSSPSDLYLEGNDQFRGWFQSSLLTSIGVRGRAPYGSVLTHGFFVDGEGKKMSKSLGNVISSEEIIEKYGAEILRLWLASEDYTEDIRVSEEILKRLVDAYRRIRNTGRYILGNLDGFDPRRDLLPCEELLEMDRWALHRLQEVIGRVRDAYDAFQFHAVYYTLYNFCAVDLSALYLDVLKDRLYTSEAASVARLSAQTVMYHILDALVKLIAPILTFTAEEIWLAMPDYEGKEQSVHFTQFPQVEEKWMNEELAQRWRTMITLKGEIAKVIETARQAKVIGHSLDVSVGLFLPPAIAQELAGAEEEMRALLIVSQLKFLDQDQLVNPVSSDAVEGLQICVTKAEGEKCQRCWIYSVTVGENTEHPAICRKCAETVAKVG